jgi:mannose-6-phosphate isomerase-like protein (cupin superfamily)
MSKYRQDMKIEKTEKVHNGLGLIEITHVLERNDCKSVSFIHDDLIEPKAEIGEHAHLKSEEIYFVLEGTGQIILDGKPFPINAGDISVCKKNHSHGIKNLGENKMRLLVIGLKN